MDETKIRDGLQERLSELESQIGSITAVPLDPMGSVSFGKRIGDGTNEAVERLNKIGVADALEAKRLEVVRALAKLDEGSYGECDSCGDRIPAERLEALPWSALCVRCASR
jgi:DnaK suppressor protein